MSSASTSSLSSAPFALHGVQLLLGLLQIGFQLAQAGVAQFGGPLQIDGPFSLLNLQPHLVHLFLDLLHLLDGLFFRLPAGV
jgi:hypothetical protein